MIGSAVANVSIKAALRGVSSIATERTQGKTK
jgi:hypothetical protein